MRIHHKESTSCPGYITKVPPKKLLAAAQLMDSLNLAERIDHHFPLPKSNRGYKPSEFIKALILMQHEGRFHLDHIRHLQEDEALRTVLDLNTLPQATTLKE
ncbi:MAG: hypothetical protein L3J62_07980 [Gammaproteobacteria bacterium]|nr:hypothetical protein [Gammaproteobacteria bacterium]MCF6230712.1 hypothetical protein [Gammaproteobacteria bacterium]